MRFLTSSEKPSNLFPNRVSYPFCMIESGRGELLQTFGDGQSAGGCCCQTLERIRLMPRILVIDDEEVIRAMLQQFLEDAGYAVDVAPNGKIGMRLCRQNRPDVVITDLVMPEQEGLETIGELRTSFPQIKIIAMSGKFIDQKVDFLSVARHLGAIRTFSKPFSLQELHAAIEDVLKDAPKPLS